MGWGIGYAVSAAIGATVLTLYSRTIVKMVIEDEEAKEDNG